MTILATERYTYISTQKDLLIWQYVNLNVNARSVASDTITNFDQD